MNRKKVTIFSAVVLVLALSAIIKAQEPSAQKKDQTLKVDVDLVLVNATVTDPQNRYVTGLEPDHFQVWEDKVEQKIAYFSAEDVPISLGVIFDISGSMKDKLSAARDAAVTCLLYTSPSPRDS